MNYLKGFLASLGMFSIIPVPFFKWNDEIVANMIPTFPLVGGVIGGLWFMTAQLMTLCNCPITLTIPILALFVPILSGFIHLDGYMDTADAILSRRPELEERRRILKDPTTGAFAVIAIIIYFILSLSAVATIVTKEISVEMLLVIPVISRGIGGLTIIALPSISDKGYGAGFRKDVKWTTFVLPTLTTAVAVGLMGCWYGSMGLLLSLVGVAVGLSVATICYHNLQGFSGDLSGCTGVITELTLMLLMGLL